MDTGGEKRVLIIANAGGFLNKFERDNVKILQRMGYEVYYAANENEQYYPCDQDEIERLGVHFRHIDIARSPYMFQLNFQAYRQLLRIVEENDIRVIHCHTPVGGLLGRLVGKRLGKRNMKVIYTAHGFHFYKGAPWINNSVYYMVEKVLAPYTDALVVINREDYESARRLRLRRGGKVYHIPGVGIDMDKYRVVDEAERHRCREKLGLSGEDFFFLSVGELNKNKNQSAVLLALAKLKEEGFVHRIQYGICGEGFLHDDLQEQIRELGLEDMVTIYGYCDHVSRFLAGADASIFPSIREGLGMAGLEALAMGVPLLAADNRGTREYMEDGKNGYVFQATDVDQLAACIRRICTLEPWERAAMRQACLDTVEPFRLEHTHAIMEQVYGYIDQKVVWDDERNYQDQCDYGYLQPQKRGRVSAGS